MEEQYTNVRFESVSFSDMKKEIKHDLRMNKISSVVNEDAASYVWREKNGELVSDYFFMNTDKSKEIGNHFLEVLPDIEKRHKKLLRKKYNQSLNQDRVNSCNMGVLTFSESMRELVKTDLDKVLELGQKTIENICNELDIKLHYISFHMDEKGIPHFHYFTDNFNSKGRTINPIRNKNLGEKLQDLGNKYFNELGFKRGISKEVTGKKHLTIQEYKDYQDTLKENKEMKEEIKQMQEVQIELTNTMLSIISDFIDLGLNYKGKDIKELISLFQKYLKNERFNDIEKLTDKLYKIAEKKGFMDNIKDFKRVKMSEEIEKLKALTKEEDNKGKGTNINR